MQQLKDVSSQRKDVSINSSMKTGTNSVQTCDGKQPECFVGRTVAVVPTGTILYFNSKCLLW